MSVVPLPEAREFLNLETDTDDELQVMLDRAESVIARRVGPLAPVPVMNEVHTGPGPLMLRRYPVIAVQFATSAGYAVTDFDFDPDSGLLHGTFSCLQRNVRVSYTAGRMDLPDDLKAAVLELLAHLWESQRVPGAGRSQVRPGFGQGGEDSPARGYLLPYRVQTLIEPFLTPVLA